VADSDARRQKARTRRDKRRVALDRRRDDTARLAQARAELKSQWLKLRALERVQRKRARADRKRHRVEEQRPRVVKSLDERVADGFDDKASPFRARYLDIALERWSEITRTARRTAIFIVVLGVGFVLVAGAQKAEFTLGPLKLTNVSSVLTIVPAIVSFALYELAALMLAASNHSKIVEALVERFYPSIAANDLDLVLAPATASLWGHEVWLGMRRRAEPGLVAVTLSRLNSWLGMTVILAPLPFLVLAFNHLYQDARADKLAVSAAAVFAVVNVLRMFLLFVDYAIDNVTEARSVREANPEVDGAMKAWREARSAFMHEVRSVFRGQRD